MTKQDIIFQIFMGLVLISNVLIVYRFWKWLSSDGIGLFGGKLVIDNDNMPVQYWILKIVVMIFMF